MNRLPVKINPVPYYHRITAITLILGLLANNQLIPFSCHIHRSHLSNSGT